MNNLISVEHTSPFCASFNILGISGHKVKSGRLLNTVYQSQLYVTKL